MGVRESGMGGEVMEEMPCVSTRGEWFLYKYGKGEEVKIVYVCHGSFLPPAEFVRESLLLSHPLYKKKNEEEPHQNGVER
ncbi:hypothetical protein MRB53_017088 [Persea americana]|uniref:Uncharacterized protein n=1 Tax=Persea americana TaxID=3435 RepID=A0ACC2M4Z1_PERAE|nr:hypothetical protein MRB53_017088 [Persea americana]